jgi:drug/metabolite transporter (DMT)-like permease
MSGHVLAIALGNSLLWSIYLLLTRHVVSGAQLDAWAYTLVQLLSAGLVLLWVGARREAGLTCSCPGRSATPSCA